MWIKEPEDDYETVSGTVVMVAKQLKSDRTSTMDDDEKKSVDLKQTSTGVILNPQPHDDPNDPLNWPIWRRDIALITVSIYALLAGGMTPLMAPVMNTLGKEFDKPFHTLTFLVGILMVSMGVGSAIFAPLAVKFGKRPVYLVALLVFFGGLCWGANADSFGSLMGARVLAGIGAAPAESLPSTTIAEIYFAHERAYRTGIYTLLLLGGKNLSPLASGFTAGRLGWHWIFWVAAIICAGAFVGCFLFVHETFWDRTPVPDRRSQEESEAAQNAREALHLPPWVPPDVGRRESYATAFEVPRPLKEEVQSQPPSPAPPSQQPQPQPQPQPQLPQPPQKKEDGEPATELSMLKRTPFFRNLAIYTGRKSKAPLWMIFLRPFVLYGYIPILYSTLIYSTSVVWLSVIAETINTIFTHEPYNFKSTSVGLLYIATFSGGVIGSMVAGKVSDWFVRKLSNRNGGIYEPEFRLIMILPVMLSVTIGLMGFGWSTQVHDKWIVPAVFMGVLGFGTSLASTVSITYVVDCYRRYALESLVSLNFAKNVLGLAFSIFVPYFFEASGGRTSYLVYGGIEIGLCLFAIPLYRYGKVLRRWHDKHPWAEKLYVNE